MPMTQYSKIYLEMSSPRREAQYSTLSYHYPKYHASISSFKIDIFEPFDDRVMPASIRKFHRY